MELTFKKVIYSIILNLIIYNLKGIVSTQMAHFFNSKDIKELTVIKVNDYSCQANPTAGL